MFEPLEFKHGLFESFAGTDFPGGAGIWDRAGLDLPSNGTVYGFVYEGKAELNCASGTFMLSQGMYFSVPGGAGLQGAGRGVYMVRNCHEGLFQIGGPIETHGRLEYIDGCSDTLLISPVRMGDPCLNLLRIPAHTKQSQHTHPSYRVGIIAAGSGECVTPTDRTRLTPGIPFVIPAFAQHSFYTDDEDLLVVAYHPDSDFGPTDENHPMINRTFLSSQEPGVSGEHRSNEMS